MNVIVGSAFRNSAHSAWSYMDQVWALQMSLIPDHSVRVVAAVGDSVDGTEIELQRQGDQLGISVEVRECSHGGPIYGSTEQSERMKALSKVGNAILDGVNTRDDALIYVESDLLWTPETMRQLLVLLPQYEVVAPLIFAGPHFYDIWGFRKDGIRFGPFAPYHSGMALTGLTPVDSAGSCLVMRAGVARDRRVRMTTGALVEWCALAWLNGYQIWVNADARIEHPA